MIKQAHDIILQNEEFERVLAEELTNGRHPPFMYSDQEKEYIIRMFKTMENRKNREKQKP